MPPTHLPNMTPWRIVRRMTLWLLVSSYLESHGNLNGMQFHDSCHFVCWQNTDVNFRKIQSVLRCLCRSLQKQSIASCAVPGAPLALLPLQIIFSPRWEEWQWRQCKEQSTSTPTCRPFWRLTRMPSDLMPDPTYCCISAVPISMLTSMWPCIYHWRCGGWQPAFQLLVLSRERLFLPLLHMRCTYCQLHMYWVPLRNALGSTPCTTLTVAIIPTVC